MDDEMSKKVRELAKSLKELHLSASMEDALKRAKEILSDKKSEGKSLHDLFGVVKKGCDFVDSETDRSKDSFVSDVKDVNRDFKDLSSDFASSVEGVRDIDEEIKKIDEKISVEKFKDVVERAESEEIADDVARLKKKVKDVEFLVRSAEKLQGSNNSKK